MLALLLLAYIFNFLDRQILGILAGPIIADLKLTDAEFGAIGGMAFAILYSVLGVPLAMLADRTSRSRVIAGALAVWSGSRRCAARRPASASCSSTGWASASARPAASHPPMR